MAKKPTIKKPTSKKLTLKEIVVILKKCPSFDSVEITKEYGESWDNGEHIEIVSKIPFYDELGESLTDSPAIYGLGYDNGVLNGFVANNGYDSNMKTLDEFLDWTMANSTYLEFKRGTIGDTKFKSVAKEIQSLHYTQPIKDLGIVLDLSIWGGTTISFNVTFWTDGSDGGNTSGYGLQSVSKEGWDGKSAEWFDSLVEDAIYHLKRTTKKVKGNYPFKELVIDINGNKLAWVLKNLVNNFLKYKKSNENYELIEDKIVKLSEELSDGSGEGVDLKVNEIISKYIGAGVDPAYIDRDESDRRDLEAVYAKLQELKNTQDEETEYQVGDIFVARSWGGVGYAIINDIDSGHVFYDLFHDDNTSVTEHESQEEFDENWSDGDYHILDKENLFLVPFSQVKVGQSGFMMGEQVPFKIVAKGKAKDFAKYDQVGFSKEEPNADAILINNDGQEGGFLVAYGDESVGVYAYGEPATQTEFDFDEFEEMVDENPELFYETYKHNLFLVQIVDAESGDEFMEWEDKTIGEILSLLETLSKGQTINYSMYGSFESMGNGKFKYWVDGDPSSTPNRPIFNLKQAKEEVILDIQRDVFDIKTPPTKPNTEEEELATFVDYLNFEGSGISDMEEFLSVILLFIPEGAGWDDIESSDGEKIVTKKVISLLKRNNVPISAVVAELKRVKAKQFIDIDKELAKSSSEFEVGDTLQDNEGGNLIVDKIVGDLVYMTDEDGGKYDPSKLSIILGKIRNGELFVLRNDSGEFKVGDGFVFESSDSLTHNAYIIDIQGSVVIFVVYERGKPYRETFTIGDGFTDTWLKIKPKPISENQLDKLQEQFAGSKESWSDGGNTAQQVWDGWSKEQKEHFLHDHPKGNSTKIDFSIYHWDALPTKTQAEVEQHISSVKYAKGSTIEVVSEKEMRKTYVKAFGREFDDKRRKQTPLPIEIAYKTALQKLERENKFAKGSTIEGIGFNYDIGGL